MSQLQGVEHQERAWMGLLWPLKGQTPAIHHIAEDICCRWRARSYTYTIKEILTDACVYTVPEGDLSSDEGTSQMPWAWM